MVRCPSKNGYQKDTCSKEIGPSAHNMITILGSIVDVIGGLRGEGNPFRPFNEHENLSV